jgi:hypothetical protein
MVSLPLDTDARIGAVARTPVVGVRGSSLGKAADLTDGGLRLRLLPLPSCLSPGPGVYRRGLYPFAVSHGFAHIARSAMYAPPAEELTCQMPSECH